MSITQREFDLHQIADLPSAMKTGRSLLRLQVAPSEKAASPLPLMEGTEAFAPPWIAAAHERFRDTGARDVACYVAANLCVAGDGQIWIDDHLVTAPEIMPPYIAARLEVANGGNDLVHGTRALPVRRIERPCVVAAGHGVSVYGHFLTEMLFRILVARRALQANFARAALLLDKRTPSWLLEILSKYLSIGHEHIEFFDAKTERVLLREGIFPTRLDRNFGYHPLANALLDETFERLGAPKPATAAPRMFITRRQFSNPASHYRRCVNEDRLIEIAANHGFVPIEIERLTWPEQIALFRNAEIVLGLAGSGLHNALFSQSGSKLASIGFMNLTQYEIGALRRQRNAFFTTDVTLAGDFSVDETEYAKLVEILCR
jgi:capsular polysaccharide biosynthesis protein